MYRVVPPKWLFLLQKKNNEKKVPKGAMMVSSTPKKYRVLYTTTLKRILLKQHVGGRVRWLLAVFQQFL